MVRKFTARIVKGKLQLLNGKKSWSNLKGHYRVIVEPLEATEKQTAFYEDTVLQVIVDHERQQASVITQAQAHELICQVQELPENFYNYTDLDKEDMSALIEQGQFFVSERL